MTRTRLSAGHRTALLLTVILTSGTVVLALLGGGRLAHGKLAAGASQPAMKAGLPGASGEALGTLAERALHALVRVGPAQSAPADHATADGLGVVVGNDTILTSAHALAGATDFDVSAYDQRHFSARLAGADPLTDLAVLTVADFSGEVTPLAFADSSTCRPGQVVLGVADSPGAGQTVRVGVISTIANDSSGAYQPFFRTDAVLATNSGGVLLDLEGRIVGIATGALADPHDFPRSLGFVLPSNSARWVMKSLLERVDVEHGFLGLTVQDLGHELATGLGVGSTAGVLVADVATGAPAARAGIARGDVIFAIDGRRVNSAAEFRARVAAGKPTSTLGLDIVRHGLRRTVETTLARAPSPSPDLVLPAQATSNPPALGLSLSALDRIERQRWAVPAALRTGVVIREVTPGTAAALAGLRTGDVLLELNGEPAMEPADVLRLFQRSRGPAAALTWRGGRTFYTAIAPKAS